eukprot:4747188-Pleurochrysis_carterae.AAC.1
MLESTDKRGWVGWSVHLWLVVPGAGYERIGGWAGACMDKWRMDEWIDGHACNMDACISQSITGWVGFFVT